MNLFGSNMFLSPLRKIFGEYADFHGFQLKPNTMNDEVLRNLDEKYPDSPFINGTHSLLRSQQPSSLEIQDFLLSSINSAKSKIVIVQPYYFPMKKFEKAIISALERGVDVELITSKKRDQPCYARLRNFTMTKRLIKKGMILREFNERFLHMKAYVFDGECYTMGSFNNDKWSWKINNEVNVLVKGREETKRFEEIIESVRIQTTQVLKKPRKLDWTGWAENKFWIFFLNSSYWAGDKRKSFLKKVTKTWPALKEGFRSNRKMFGGFIKSKFFVDWDYDVFETI